MSYKRLLPILVLLAIAAPVCVAQGEQGHEGRQSRETTASVQSTTTAHSSSTDLGWQSWGLRAGVTDDADQVVGGAHFNLGEVANDLRLQPDVQLGSGDDVTTLYGTVPVYYRFDRARGMTPYAGGGLALGWVDADNPNGTQGDNTSFEVGAKVTGGLEWPRQSGQAFFVELSLGIGDIYDAQVVAAWTF